VVSASSESNLVSAQGSDLGRLDDAVVSKHANMLILDLSLCESVTEAVNMAKTASISVFLLRFGHLSRFWAVYHPGSCTVLENSRCIARR
jgi:hypothetical protein